MTTYRRVLNLTLHAERNYRRNRPFSSPGRSSTGDIVPIKLVGPNTAVFGIIIGYGNVINIINYSLYV